MRVLLVEDDLLLGPALARALEQARFDCVWVRRLAEARSQCAAPLAAIVLDVNLPDGEGFALLRELRDLQSRTPVLVMTARDGLDDRLRGFDSGADDYLVKPFAVVELIARLRAILRRAAGQADDRWIIGDLVVDVGRHVVTVGGEPVALTPTEFRLLVEFAGRAGRVLERDALIRRLWGDSEEGSDAALEFQVHGLRRKIGAARIRTVRGAGYALEAE